MTKVYGALFFLANFLIIYNSHFCAAYELTETEFYNVDSGLPHIDSTYLVRLRTKRQTSTDQKNEYESIPQNGNATKQSTPVVTNAATVALAAAAPAAQGVGTAAMSVVPYSASDHPNLGVNGTGQRKDAVEPADSLKPAIITNPAAAATADAAPKPTAFPKKVLGKDLNAASTTESTEDRLIDNIDVPDDDTINAIKNNNMTVNMTNDYHIYYNSSIYINKAEAEQVWSRIKNTTHNSMLSQSHRRAMTVELSFPFPFYGHPVRNITVATGGFLYTGEYVHSWLAATQYIAPLMANFDTSLSDESFVRINDNGTAFTVIWEKVSLQDKQDVGKFTFSTTLHKNGDIVFAYFEVPIFVNAIQDDKHPVKVGLSDAYIIDKTVYFARRKTIYEYHRVNFADAPITNSTFIYLKALPTCLDYTDCVSCINHTTSFDCAWCPVLNRCSTGTDRRKQEWLQRGCDRAQITNSDTCPALGQKGNNAHQTIPEDNNNNNSINSNNNTPQTGNTNNNNNNNSPNDDATHPTEATITPVNAKPSGSALQGNVAKAAIDDHHEPKGMGLALGFLVPICLIVTILLWVLYAYRNPHTKSGQLLIHYRPSQWSWRRGEARYTAATIHM